MDGYNGTIFAYGQTGTGKTHTMEGVWEVPELRGITPRSFSFMFEQIDGMRNVSFLIRASYLEIYNEEVRDLLSKDPSKKLDLKEDMEKGVYVKDLTQHIVRSHKDCEQVMLAGKRNRSIGATLMNAESSRSHSVFTIVVESSKNDAGGESHVRVGKLNLVDLAGSERQGKTGATGDRLKEATKINLSLSALGNVISALVDAKIAHIPYRDSKLTRLLQDSLGGNTRTVMVANIGPADYNYDETLSTLRYANRAKSIKNKPKINEDPKDAMLRQFQEEIEALKAQLEARGGAHIPGFSPAAGDEDAVLSMSTEELEANKSELEQQKRALKEQEAVDKEVKELELKKREEEITREQRAREHLAKQIAAMQAQIMQSNADEEKVRELEEKAQAARNLIDEQLNKERELREQLKSKEDEQLNIEEEFTSLQEELVAKTKKLKKLFSKYEQVKEQVTEAKEMNQREREDLLGIIRQQDKELKLLMLVVNSFIPEEYLEKIQDVASYDDQQSVWDISHLKVSGRQEELRRNRVEGNKKPTSSDSSESENVWEMSPAIAEKNIFFSYPGSSKSSERPQSSRKTGKKGK
uniref:Kinesin-like protein n=1 Tax=Hanusia phi TaxID=3032 RepID=A0A7S0EHV7_9CRYP